MKELYNVYTVTGGSSYCLYSTGYLLIGAKTYKEAHNYWEKWVDEQIEKEKRFKEKHGDFSGMFSNYPEHTEPPVKEPVEHLKTTERGILHNWLVWQRG